MNDRQKYIIKASPIVLILLNLILKLIFISTNSIGGDEPFSIYHAQMEISSIVHHLSSGNNPPLYEILLHFWIKVFGISELSVRFPSLIFSVFTVYFVYKIGYDFFNYRIALIAGFLFSFSNYYIAFAHEARVYSLFAFLTAMSMYAFLCLLESKERKNIYILILITANILLIYSHFFGFFVIFVQLLYSFVLYNQNRQLSKRLLFYQIVVFVFYIPYYPIIFERFLVSSIEGTWIKPPNGIYSILDMIRIFNNEQYGQKTLFGNKPWITLLYLIIFILSFVKVIYNKAYRKINNKYLYVFLCFVLPFTVMFIASYKIPMFLDRYLVFIVIGYYITLAVAIDFLFTNTRNKIIFSTICVLGMVVTSTPNVDNKRHVKATVDMIKDLEDNNSIVLICPQHFVPNFAYYYNQEIFRNVDNQNVYNRMLEQLKTHNIYFINNINYVNLNGVNRVLYLDAAAQFSFPNNNIIPALEKGYELNNEYKFYEIFTIYEFQSKSELRN